MLPAALAGAQTADDGQVDFRTRCDAASRECAFTAAGLKAQQHRPGTLDVEWQPPQGPAQTWQITAKDFVRLVHCDETICSLPSNKGCYAGCLATPPIPKLFDLRRQRLYFTVLGFDHEVMLFVYDRAAQAVSLVLEDRSRKDIEDLHLSPERRYLAYLRSYEGSWCEGFARVRIRDLRDGKTLVYPGDVDPVKRVLQMRLVVSDSDPRWLSESEIELRRREWTVESCDSGDHPEDDRVTVLRLRVPPEP